MINIKEEDTKIFEQNGFSQEDVGNTVNHYRQHGMSDNDIQKKINLRLEMWKHPENVTPYMQIANNPNLTKEEKVSQINALKAKEDEQNSLENLNKQYAKNKIEKINASKEKHPFLTAMNSMFNPASDANDNYLKEMAETGHTTLKGTIKRGAMGGLTTLGDIASVMSGGAALGANGAKLNNVSKILKTAKAGSLGFAAPTASNSINKVINEEMTPKEALTETGKSALTGAVVAPVGLVSNAGVKNAVKQSMINNAKKEIAQETVKKGYPLHEEILNNLADKMVNAKSKQALTGMLMETPSALVSGSVDTATMAGIDYALNKMQNKEQGTYLDHLKEYAPFIGFSAIPVLSKGVSPVINKAVNSKTGQMIKENINNSHSLSKMDAEIRNSLNLGESSLDNVKKYQTIDKHLQKISGSKVKQLPQEEIQNIINAGKISEQEEEKLIDSWKNGNKQKSENKNDLTPQDKFDVIRDSKLTEKDLIDLGIITAEQARNRILQHHRAGKGIYYQQFSNHKIDGIDIDRDYFLEKNNKKGWFGRKVKEGLTDKATVQDIVRNIKLRKIQASNIKEALNFIEKNFAQSIDEKGIKQGYVPVNKHLLANAMWGKTTKEWYKTLEQGEDAINKAFKNKKQAQGWIELHNRTKTHDFQIPEELFNTLFDGRGENLAEYWNRYENAFKGKTAKLAGTILDIGNNFFKRRVLGTTSFVLNNRMNQLMIAAKSDNPIEYLKSIFQAKNIKDIDLPSEILENSIAEAVENSVKRRTYTGINQLDNLLNLFGGHTIDTKTLTGWKKLTAKTGNIVFGFPNKLYNSLANKLLDFNTKFETFERKQVFAQEIDKAKAEILQKTGQKMISMQEAVKYVHSHPELKETIIRNIENTLGDYNNFNKFERDILKRVIPFYSWYRTIFRHTIHLAKENPSRCAMIFAELQKLENDDEDLKQWQKGSFKLPFKDERNGKQLLINKSRQIPWNTLKEVGEPEGKASAITPMLRIPTEAVKGKKFFNNGEITNRRYIRKKNFDTKTNKEHPYIYYDTKENKYIDNLPVSTRLGYMGKEVLRDVEPLIYNNTTNLEGIYGGIKNKINNGKFLEYDKSYDASLGGFNSGDVAGYTKNSKKGLKPIKRYANDTSESVKLLNRLGLTLQPQYELSKEEKEALKARTKKYKAKHKKA